MTRHYSNTAVATTLSAGIGASDLSCSVVSAAGYPAVPFAIVVGSGTASEEVMQVTAVVGLVFTVTRGFDGTSASAHGAGATVIHAVIAGDLTDLQAADTSEASTRATDDAALASLIAAEASIRAAADLLLTPMSRTLTINGTALDLSANRSWTIPAGVGTVTSVGLALPSLFTVTVSPITGAGTLTAILANQPANTVLAGPATGADATPTMRALVAADLPAVSLTTGVSGILPSANGGSGVANAGNLAWPASGGTAALLAVENVFSVRQGIRAAPSVGSVAGLYVPYIPGDTGTTVLVGSSSSGQVAIDARSGSVAGVTASTVSGSAALTATSGSAASPAIAAFKSAATANAVTSLVSLYQRTAGGASNGFGASLDVNLKSSTTVDQPAGSSATLWVDATHATRKARRVETVNDFGGAREYLRGEADGTNPMIGFLGASASARATISGSRAGNVALAALLTELATKGIIVDGSSA